MQTVQDDVDSSRFVLMRVIEYLIIIKQYINDMITRIHTTYCCFLKHHYGVINSVKSCGLLFYGRRYVLPLQRRQSVLSRCQIGADA